MEEKELFLTATTKPFAGITEAKEFEKVLDQQDEIVGYTQDHEHYYRFLIDYRPVLQILS